VTQQQMFPTIGFTDFGPAPGNGESRGRLVAHQDGARQTMYVAKSKETRPFPFALVNEGFAALLAEHLGLPVPEFNRIWF
jgi:hypothetical protein